MKKQNQFNSILLILIWLMHALPVHAASFDCGKAKTEIENLICSSAKLSKLDDEIAIAYREAIKRVTALDNEKATVERYRSFQEAGEKVVTYADHAKFRQRSWLRGRVYCETANCLEDEYQKRIAALRDGMGGAGYDNERIYRYKLEMSEDGQVCQHMLNVYNKHFSELWNQQKYRPITSSHIALEDFFQRLPAIDYNVELARKMVYSRFPASPEFEAIKWLEGRAMLKGNDPDSTHLYPLLVSEFDIDNDGNDETIIKSNFMWGYTILAGRNVEDKGSDELTIYPKGAIIFDGIVDIGEIHRGPTNTLKPRVLYARQLRPFIFNGTTYISKYESIWPAEELERLPTQEYRFPTKEYIYIQKYLSGGHFLAPGKYTQPEIQPICRFRMLPKP